MTAALLLLDRFEFAAPALLHMELANIIWRKRRKTLLTASEATAAATVLEAAPFEHHDETGLWLRALDLAVERDHPAYDCTYVALAERVRAAAVVTADRRFAKAFAEWRAPHVTDRPFVLMVGDAAGLLAQ